MKGIELSRAFWEECGRPMLEERFPELTGLVAVGLVGAGSECYGYDDEISRDHDFEHGFCFYLPDEERVSRRQEFLLGRAYESLPKEFMGLRRSMFNPAGGNRHGVFRTAEVYRAMTGIPGKPEGWRDYLRVPDEALAEATNGVVFYDGLGEFSAIREAWKNPPRDVQLKKLCGYLIRMSQTGEYNFERCLKRLDPASAQLVIAEFAKATAGAWEWIHNRPSPYYKWRLRSLAEYSDSTRLYPMLCSLLLGGRRDPGAESLFEGIGRNGDGSYAAAELIAGICSEVLVHVRKAFPECPQDADLQRTALALNDRIGDGVLRSMSPLAAIG
ncbi:MAG: DUF4037 domain-containing protein [Lachnospiraceae bacterium]|nr:DUF4037 domain-containing protein [Lachnospiraceae bacterium]